MAKTDTENGVKNTELSASQELVNIKQEKLAIEANLKKQEAICYKKFAVNTCLKDAKTEAQIALNAVKRHEVAVNELQRNAKIQADQNKREAATAKTTAGSSADDKTSEAKDRNKTIKTAKSPKTIKSDAEIASDKQAADKSRAEAAQQRVVEANQKQAASQKKAQIRANKKLQSDSNTAKYNQKINQAEEHKQVLEKAKLAKTKVKSAPLPIPSVTTP